MHGFAIDFLLALGFAVLVYAFIWAAIWATRPPKE